MKILLSAYACEPDKGSEPGVGWNWALALARRGYEVHVLTRSNNRESIERERTQLNARLHFHFFDYPEWLRFWKHWPGGIYAYYLLWQLGAYREAKRLHAREQFDLVQHITFVSYRQPSFMGWLRIPFIFGPVGGGESMPPHLRKGLPWKARLAETVRDFGNRFAGVDPLLRQTYSQAQLIPCATEETLKAIPVRFHSKCIVQRAIGMGDSEWKTALSSESREEPTASRPQFLFVGRLLYWKGLHLVFRALGRVKQEIPDVVLRVVGEGPDRDWLIQVAEQAKIMDRVEWISKVPHSEMQNEYTTSLGFVFPSLHDSGGMVVLEAMAAGLPVICLDRGGPGSMVDSSCGVVLQTGAKSEARIIDQLAQEMVRFVREPETRAQMSAGAKKRAGALSWDAAAEGVYAAPKLAASDTRLSVSY